MIKTDSVVEAVREDLLRRSAIGIKKYNVTLDRTDLSLVDWLQHAYEECLDQANYLKKSILTLKNQEIKMQDNQSITIDPKGLAKQLAEQSVLETITNHNATYPNNLKEVFEVLDEITPEKQELQYTPFAQAIFDERQEHYYKHITNA